MNKIGLTIWVILMTACIYFGFIEPRMYVYDNYQNRGTHPASWGQGTGTLRIHKLSGEIQKYCVDPSVIDFWEDWWEPVGKAATPQEKEEIISYFKQLQDAGRNASKKRPVPLVTLEKLKEDS